VDDQRLRWREADEVPPSAQAIRTPYDPEAHFSQKRSTAWVGYKVHFTETCDPDLPRLVTHVETTPATTQDNKVLIIHQTLQTRDCCRLSIVDCVLSVEK
jgi:transposase